MERFETFSTELAPGEPAPPASGELFAGHEVAAFESFLDNLATENEFLFHPKVPASLSWDGFHTTRNQAFDEFKHSGLQFGSDVHFSTTNGYVATHKYVPVGYGHVHPQSSAQRSQRSSASSRTPSRRPSIYSEGPHVSPLPDRGNTGNIVAETSMITSGPGPAYRNEMSTYDSQLPTLTQRTDVLAEEHATQREIQQRGTNFELARFRKPEGYTQTMNSPLTGIHSHHKSSNTMRSVGSPALSTGFQDSSETESSVKKIKLEDGTGKQPLTSAQKRQNHISSEQRRRNLIKEGFNELSNIVPNVVGNASKSTILHEAIEYIRKNNSRNNELRRQIEESKARRTTST